LVHARDSASEWSQLDDMDHASGGCFSAGYKIDSVL
jgi:hypothetical protein